MQHHHNLYGIYTKNIDTEHCLVQRQIRTTHTQKEVIENGYCHTYFFIRTFMSTQWFNNKYVAYPLLMQTENGKHFQVTVETVIM